MKTYQYLIIGGGIAGGKAIEGIREVDPEGTIGLVTSEPFEPYERPPLSKKYLRGDADLDDVLLHDDTFYEKNNIDLLSGIRAKALDPAQRQVELENGDILHYDKLLLATGGKAIRLDMPGNDLENVFTLRSIRDARAIRAAAEDAKTALVMGGGFIGAEVGASLSMSGLNVTVIFPEERLLEDIVPEGLSEHLRVLYRQHGVSLLPEHIAARLEGEEGKVKDALLENGIRLFADLVVMGVGIQLNTSLAEDAGLEIRAGDRALLVDRKLRTSDPNIFAAGDIAAWPDETFGKRLRVEHWDAARAQGILAGRNMAGAGETYDELPYFFSDLFDLSFEVWGDLSAWDQTLLDGTYESGSFALYYFEENVLTGVLAVNPSDEARESIQDLIRSRPSPGKVAALLENEQMALSAAA